MIKAHYSGEIIFSNSPESFSLYEKSCFGEKKNNRIEYASFEALFLLKERKMNILQGKKEINFQDLIKKLKKQDKRIESKFIVFEDLRKKGYVVKTALKFGAEFRIYDRGIKPGEDYSKWILYIVKENDSLNWHDFAAKNRVAHSTKKNLLIGIVDEESDTSYYEVSWKKI